jgi:hypothetical protein
MGVKRALRSVSALFIAGTVVFGGLSNQGASAADSHSRHGGVGYMRLRVHLYRYHVSVVVPQLVGGGSASLAVNASLKAEAAALPAQWLQMFPSQREGPKNPPGYFFADSQAGFTSSSPLLVNTLIPVVAGCGVCTDTEYWASDAALVSNGQRFNPYAGIFSNRELALKAIVRDLRWQYRHIRAPNTCVAQMRQVGIKELGTPSALLGYVIDAHAFALLANGLEVGIEQGALYDEACGDSGFLVPYSVIDPYLNDLGHHLVESFLYEPVAPGPGFVTPVHNCPSELIDYPRSSSNPPRQQRVNVPEPVASQVAIYTETGEILRLLAPNGWHCIVWTSEDGGAIFDVFPPWETSPRFFQTFPPTHSRRQGITLYAEPACGSCLFSIACPYFASARAAMHKEGVWFPDSAKECRPPRHEVVRQLTGSIVQAVDPPGVIGDNWPTGGPYTAISDIAYSGYAERHAPPFGASILTCTLPPQDETLCLGTLAWFEDTNHY